MLRVSQLLEPDDELMDVEHDVVQGYSNTWGRGLDRETIKTRLMAREYEVDIVTWFSRAWYLYKNHWQILTIWGVIYAVRLPISSPHLPQNRQLELETPNP